METQVPRQVESKSAAASSYGGTRPVRSVDLSNPKLQTLIAGLAPLLQPRPGSKTTEVWIALLVVGALVGGMFVGKVPATMAMPLSTLIALAIAIARTLVKQSHGDDMNELLGKVLDVAAPMLVPPQLQILIPNNQAEAEVAPHDNGGKAAPAAAPPSGGAGLGAAAAAVVALVMLTGCAETVFYDRHSGKPIARFQGDMEGSHYRDGNTSWDVDKVSHSAATLAQGEAATRVGGAVGTVVGTIGTAIATKGLVH